MSVGDPRDVVTGAGTTEGFARAVDHSLRDQWAYVQGSYDDVHRHDAFMAACLAEGQLAFADACYAEMLHRDPADAVAAVRREEICKQRMSGEASGPAPAALKGWGRLRRWLGLS